ncbi:hypothetical protein PF010_g6869 [Phytophthora fragariae]|uniref:RNA polymerase Rpb4/RPC9 core domain-containing protein n=2 Tax=Phytophthora fragariae TaxID=53985 RepID=A0A6A3KCE9_9STRA|nr:hypothetical protein PF009_g14458 [Phytophthora fragariae]KAE9005086.1 hypothetical protein PF011_g12192 [Phytophthora fragariae]KAE9105793.1 hypothetical protein PF007_g13637 [Phytophthora fragariae]KAE9122073.1 hypothetical protein PF010_g6869 [Phytophthora fragariae]KAE9223190.1 hypothetical protein PF004_g12591 [Phytophthora fragariae]
MAFTSRPLMESTDAAALNIGEDFEDEVCLSNAEVAIILEKQKINYVEQKKTFTRAFKKTESYVLRFTGTRDPLVNQASVIELREALQSISFEHDDEVHRLEEFEIACLSNLNPEGAEEAVALIPSLSKHFTDNEIEEILGMISRLTAKIFS